MKINPTAIPDVKLIQQSVFSDERGWFAESWNAEKFAEAGVPKVFVQDNQSKSHANVLRGLHYQVGKPQGKLVRVLRGQIFDVAVDLRRSSATFGKWVGVELRGTDLIDSLEIFWIPEGFAHGFLVQSESAEVAYKATAPYYPQGERTILWNDPQVGVNWPVLAPPIVSRKDLQGLSWADAISEFE
jgi:dTDP-4-dehydrorhamnose 3,5-epimerase